MTARLPVGSDGDRVRVPRADALSITRKSLGWPRPRAATATSLAHLWGFGAWVPVGLGWIRSAVAGEAARRTCLHELTSATNREEDKLGGTGHAGLAATVTHAGPGSPAAATDGPAAGRPPAARRGWLLPRRLGMSGTVTRPQRQLSDALWARQTLTRCTLGRSPATSTPESLCCILWLHV